MEMATEHARQALQAAIGMEFYYHKQEWIHQMYCCVSLNNRLSVGYTNRATNLQEILNGVQVTSMP